MNLYPENISGPNGDAFRDFALACRTERDRLAVARLAEEDRRFETSGAERRIAELFVERLIATVAGR